MIFLTAKNAGNGGPCRNRTYDQKIKSLLVFSLYSVSYIFFILTVESLKRKCGVEQNTFSDRPDTAVKGRGILLFINNLKNDVLRNKHVYVN